MINLYNDEYSSCLVFFYLEHNTISADIKSNIHMKHETNC